ncbi:Hypothetical predicted protein [Podarcis lilfordi]|uniref:Uncharacterized protein n=1 Tax=Podarcis lilfordi TaxID=74358 RepID=A0AA35L5F8_9SAUR|nr:Hypothetical predicted protein [Podarcis lilfordi]
MVEKWGALIRSGREPFPNIYCVLVKSLERCDDPQRGEGPGRDWSPDKGLSPQRAVVWGNRNQPSSSQTVPGNPAKSGGESGQNKGGKAPSSVWEPFPNTYFVLAKSLERRGEHQGHASRDEAPAPAPGMKNRTTSRRFPAVVPCGVSPLPLLCTGMAPSRPGLAQKHQPKLPPIKTASRVISEREETLAIASVLGRSDACTVEKWGALIRSAREKFSRGTAAFLQEGLEPRQQPLAPEVMGQGGGRGP